MIKDFFLPIFIFLMSFVKDILSTMWGKVESLFFFLAFNPKKRKRLTFTNMFKKLLCIVWVVILSEKYL